MIPLGPIFQAVGAVVDLIIEPSKISRTVEEVKK
mgnify:FL=1